MAKLKRLKIEKFRNVEPGTELAFHDGWNVLLGKNGTGKTTLLKLISMALSANFAGIKDEEFALEYEILAPRGSLSVSVRSRPIVSSFSGTPKLLHERTDWSYTASLRDTNGSFLASIKASQTSASGRVGDSGAPVALPVMAPFRGSFLGNLWSELVHQSGDSIQLYALLGDISKLFGYERFDEALGAFEQITSNTLAHEDPLDGVSLIFLGLPTSDDMAADSMVLFPVRVPASIVGSFQEERPPVGSDQITFSQRNLPFLQKVVELCGFQEGHLSMMLESSKTKETGVEIRYGKFSFGFALDNASRINHEALSYGQKRLLSFLYHLALNDDVIIADELVNGLHYDWIEACIDEIGDRQAFLTSQNPVLLDFLAFASPEEVRRSFLLCSREARAGGSIMHWKNLEEETSEEFFRSYKTRALQVSEILRTKGLW